MSEISSFARTLRAFVLYTLAPAVVALLLCAGSAAAQSDSAKQANAPAKKSVASQSKPAPSPIGAHTDLSKQPTLYVVGYAHLDTEWRWEYPQSIDEYLSKTMRMNFALFEKYPHYIFNFSGANRYRLMKEYFPDDFARLRKYVAAGRWFPAGSSMEEGDVNAPNAEAIIRQVLYGNNWFRREFGKASEEFMLPDCFGFPQSLPSILAHASIKGFSTQKLSSGWQPAPHVGGPDSPEKTPLGIPFNVGVWEGPDGKTILAALNPLSYGSQVFYDLSKAPPTFAPDPNLTEQQNRQRTQPQEDWPARIDINGKLTGIFADYHYVGTGDIGGAANEPSIYWMEGITSRSKIPVPPRFGSGQFGVQMSAPSGPPVQLGDGPVRVVWSQADQIFKDILACCKTDKMPRYKGDLELINHSAGSLSSQAYQKRWNRKNELLADAAEKASVAAAWLGARPYPLERLNNAWTLVMGGHFHDIMAGTATPKSYEFSWNDQVIAMNQFAGVLTSATEGVAAAMDTQAKGAAVVVYNPLNVAREDVVEATVSLSGPAPAAVRVTGPDGKEVPAQFLGVKEGAARILFIARVSSVGYAVYDVRPSDAALSSTDLHANSFSLENARYRVELSRGGDISSIFDKKLNRELLSAPIRLAISTDNPAQWPAWNMDFEDEQRAPRDYVDGAASIRVVETGPVRVSVEITREAEGSKFVQTVRLSAGDAGNRFEIGHVMDWNTREANLKAVFPLAAANPNATYNWDVGTIERPNEFDRQFEVASHQWIDLTDASGSFGVTILTDCKNASDKPNDRTLRLTLVRTPGTRGGYVDQATQDLGHHEFVYGIAGHEGDWRAGRTDWQAYRLNQPLIAFESAKHAGKLGREFSMLTVGSNHVRVLAMKKAEASDELIVRAVETDGKDDPKVGFTFAGHVIDAREVNGQEMPAGAALATSGALVTSFTPYQIRSFAVKLAPAATRMAAPQSRPLALPFDTSVATHDGKPGEGCFDCLLESPGATQGKALPAEMLPHEIAFAGIHFNLAPTGHNNAVAARGQKLALPEGKYNRVYILAAAARNDQHGTFHLGDVPSDVTVEEWTGFIGQWDTRIWKQVEAPLPPEPAEGDMSQAAQRARRIRARVQQNGPIMNDEFAALRPGYIKRADVAWFASHRHDSAGAGEAYAYSYLFAYALDLPAGAKTLTLPENPNIRILAVTLADAGPGVRPAQPLYDTLGRAER
jgi:alpha-mannosidase